MRADDDGAVCVGIVVYTPAWSAAYNEQDVPATRAFVAVVERRDGLALEPVLVPPALLGEFLAALTPPVVTIRSASGEDVREPQRLVELATAGGAAH